MKLIIVEDLSEELIVGLIDTAGVKQRFDCLLSEVVMFAAVIVGDGHQAGSARGLAVVVGDDVVDSLGTVHAGLCRREDRVEAAVVGEDIEAHICV